MEPDSSPMAQFAAVVADYVSPASLKPHIDLPLLRESHLL